MKQKRIAILGSTGSIGTQALDVIAANPDRFEVFALTANNNVSLLIEQARRFKPTMVVVANDAHYEELREALSGEDITVFATPQSVAEVAAMRSVDVVLTAMVGYAGLLPTIKALEAGKTIALANKETLVVAGELIKSLALKHKAPILPVDSEHSAIFQCLMGEADNEIEKILLTASGGALRNYTCEQLATVTAQQALRHPNWSMGAKITIDSATLMNKGFEAIEAKWLFDVSMEQIEVVVHPQSIIHSMVQFADGSIKAQLGTPDMRIPIQYALTWPERVHSNCERLNFFDLAQLTFERPDTGRFPNLTLAFEASRQGGNMPCILNAANEVAVAAFLRGEIGFMQMSRLIETVMQQCTFVASPDYEVYVVTDAEARTKATELLKSI
ncbi:MAG: 1-deoxy-D-xylulose-5-phosphate reductoisomerase [Paludibacteraceae bacterium]|nr:1-deoxy-D-xylulose-5-phosphate reductoisomerase [Paludibacteraceae bacterium]